MVLVGVRFPHNYKMKLLLVQYRPAIRLYKWAMTLKECHDVTICYTTELGLGLDWSKFDTIHYDSVNVLNYDRYISFNPGIDISHCSRIPTIQAVGDLKSANETNTQEIETLRKAYKCIFISKSQERFANAITGGIASTYYINGVILEMIGEKLPKLNKQRLQLVYSGTIVNTPGHHRNIIDKLKDIKANNDCDIHIYPSQISNGEGYEDFIVHESVSPYDLISELSQYDAGIFVLSSSEEVMSHALPNKVFEYLAAGIPVLSEPYKEVIRHHGIYTMDDFKIKHLPLTDHSEFAKYYTKELCDIVY